MSWREHGQAAEQMMSVAEKNNRFGFLDFSRHQSFKVVARPRQCFRRKRINRRTIKWSTRCGAASQVSKKGCWTLAGREFKLPDHQDGRTIRLVPVSQIPALEGGAPASRAFPQFVSKSGTRGARPSSHEMASRGTFRCCHALVPVFV